MLEDKRKDDRSSVKDGVLYLHESRSITEAAQNGLAFDISRAGACIYTQQEFLEGDTIKVYCSKFGDMPIKTSVRWCRKVDDRLFKVGVSFSSQMD